MLPTLLLLAALQPAQYLVCEIDRNDVITVRSASEVMVEGELLQPRSFSIEGDVDVELFDGDRRLFRTSIAVDRFTRAEFPGPNGTLEGRWLERERTPFVVRIPRGGDAVQLTSRRGRRTTRIATRELPLRDAPSAMSMRTPTVQSGSAANRLDILVLGDGYTSTQSALFQSHVNGVMAEFFRIPPYSTYANYINVTSFFVASPQSGADHPDCADGGPDPLEGTYVNTAFDASYCSSGLQRLLTVNYTKVYDAAAAAPEWDRIIVIVNDTMYGGSGGSISVVSANDLAVSIAQHELGHSFSGLADEYDGAFPGYPSCSDLGGAAPCEPNVTNVSTRASVKWGPWISPSTPVPTVPQSNYPGVPGLFEGARYHASGFYRPRYGCMMRSTDAPFCEVCKQAFVLRLYNGWGGIPSGGIDAIEPGSESPEGTSNGVVGEAKTFTATILEPAGGPAATKQWAVDGVLQQGATGASFTWTPTSAGTRYVELRVRDTTPLVHASMAGTSLDSSRTWVVNVSQFAAPAGFQAYGNAANVSLFWSAVAGAPSYEIARSSGGAFTIIATVGTSSYTDTAVTAGNAYVYKVRAAGGPYSAPDLAAVFGATDDPLTASSVVKAVHLTELRAAINAARTAAGLAPASYTSTPTAGFPVRANDIQQMRTALNAARSSLGIPTISFTDPTLTIIRNAHVTELRNGVR